jgi:hydroxypyruvate isomerase
MALARSTFSTGRNIMPRFAANLSMLFTELSFLDRFALAARAGFTRVEFLFPYAFSLGEISQALNANGLQAVLFNLPPGDLEGGERGLAALPGREEEFAKGLETALGYARAARCPKGSRHGGHCASWSGLCRNGAGL